MHMHLNDVSRFQWEQVPSKQLRKAPVLLVGPLLSNSISQQTNKISLSHPSRHSFSMQSIIISRHWQGGDSFSKDGACSEERDFLLLKSFCHMLAVPVAYLWSGAARGRMMEGKGRPEIAAWGILGAGPKLHESVSLFRTPGMGLLMFSYYWKVRIRSLMERKPCYLGTYVMPFCTCYSLSVRWNYYPLTEEKTEAQTGLKLSMPPAGRNQLEIELGYVWILSQPSLRWSTPPDIH